MKSYLRSMEEPCLTINFVYSLEFIRLILMRSVSVFGSNWTYCSLLSVLIIPTIYFDCIRDWLLILLLDIYFKTYFHWNWKFGLILYQVAIYILSAHLAILEVGRKWWSGRGGERESSYCHRTRIEEKEELMADGEYHRVMEGFSGRCYEASFISIPFGKEQSLYNGFS